MEKETDLMGTSDAARYLQVGVETLNYHVRVGHVTPQVIGRTRLFTRAQLDALRPRIGQRPGRPPKRPKDQMHELDQA